MREEKPPLLIKYRSSNLYVLVSVSFAFFTDLLIDSVITPVIPFVIDAMNRGIPPNKLSETSAYSDNIHIMQGVSSDTGKLISIFAIALAIGSPIFGYLGDKVKHRKGLMLAGMFTLFGSLFFFLYGSHFGMFAAARALQGFAEACICTLGMTIISDTFSDDQLGRQTSIVMIFHLAGLGAGGAAGALFVHFGYKAPFIFCLAVAGIDFLLRLGLVERRNNPKHWFESSIQDAPNHQRTDTSQHENELTMWESSISEHETGTVVNEYKDTEKYDVGHEVESHTKTGSEEKSTITMLQLLCDPRILTVLLVSFGHGFCITVFEPTMPIHLANEWGLDASKIGLLYFAQVFPSFIASPLAGYIYDRTGAKMISFLTIVLCAAVIALMGIPNANTAGGAAPLVVLAGMNEFFAGAFYAVTLPEASLAAKALANGNDSGVSRSYGLHNVAYALGHFVGPLLGGYVFDKIGFFWMCIIVASFLLLSAPFALIYLGNEVTSFPALYKRLHF